MLLEPRLNCATGQLYYTCSSNSFAGCCSIDPCDLLDCPDSSATSGSSSVFSIVPISFVITSAKPSTSLDQSTTESSTSVHTSSSATTTQSLSSTSSSESSLSTSASPTASRESQLSHSTPKTKSETPLIAGLASTLIAFIFIISILVCICRRRRQQRHHSYRRAQHDESKPPSYPSTPQTRGSKDIFAEFGGKLFLLYLSLPSKLTFRIQATFAVLVLPLLYQQRYHAIQRSARKTRTKKTHCRHILRLRSTSSTVDR
jgi:hypothetical protein